MNQGTSRNWALQEYGLSKAELRRAIRKINRKAKSEITKKWDGTAKSLAG